MSRSSKMVIVVRKDLKNTKGEKVRTGKLIAQACHSVFGFIWNNLSGKKISFTLSDVQYDWYKNGQTKICLSVKDEKELLEIYQSAKEHGLPVELITDAGRTEFAEPTKTCCSIGPAWSNEIDSVTGHLSTF
jgi:PTH2 family peptidyl-tRNA hydrolase